MHNPLETGGKSISKFKPSSPYKKDGTKTFESFIFYLIIYLKKLDWKVCWLRLIDWQRLKTNQ